MNKGVSPEAVRDSKPSNFSNALYEETLNKLQGIWSIGVPSNYRADMDRYIEGMGTSHGADRLKDGKTGTEVRIKFR